MYFCITISCNVSLLIRNDNNSNNTVNGSDDKGMVKRAAENALASLFGEELAREMIAGWNAAGEFVGGMATAGALTYGAKKGYDRLASSQPVTTVPNTASNPNGTTANSNIDNPNNSMEDSLKRYGNAGISQVYFVL